MRIIFATVALLLFGAVIASPTGKRVGVPTAQSVQYTCPNGRFQYAESIPVQVNLKTNLTTTNAWVSLINSAKSTIDVAAFYVTLTGGDIDGMLVYNALLEAALRGVQVRMAINQYSQSQPDTDVRALVNASSNIQAEWVNMTQFFGAGIIHTKFFVVDSASFYVGSANFDWRSLTQVKELGVVVNNCPLLAIDLLKTFEIYWIAGQVKTLPATWPSSTFTTYNINTPAQVTLNGTKNNVYLTGSPPQFCAPNRTFDLDSIQAVMASAQETISIEVMDYMPAVVYQSPSFYWPYIDDAIRAAAYRGVQVSLLIGYWSHSDPAMMPYLDSLDVLSNVEVRLMKIPAVYPVVPYTRVNHAKFMVTEQTAFVTTSNWVGDYFTTTAGVSYVTDFDVAVNDLQGAFDRDWNSNYTTSLPPFTARSCKH